MGRLEELTSEPDGLPGFKDKPPDTCPPDPVLAVLFKGWWWWWSGKSLVASSEEVMEEHFLLRVEFQ